MTYTSQEIGELALALANAQGSYKVLQPNAHSVHGPFANLEAILVAVQPALKDNGLAFIQYTELLDSGLGARLLWSFLSHKSNQWQKSCARLVDDGTDRANDTRNQNIRRTQASYLLGIAPSANDPAMLDDDGESQAHEAVIEELKKVRNGEQPVKKARYETITKIQYEDLMIELNGYPEILQGVLNTYGIETCADLPATEYHPAKNKIMGLKDEYKKYLKKHVRQ
jgi:hypothetical protein